MHENTECPHCGALGVWEIDGTDLYCAECGEVLDDIEEEDEDGLDG